MEFTRASGVLLHPTSLPGPFGIGEFGEEAQRFVDWLVRARQQLWQVLPLGPTGYGDSPYASFSAFAGNPLLIGLQWLQGAGLLTKAELEAFPALPADKVEFGSVFAAKNLLLRKAYDRWKLTTGQEDRKRFDQFCAENGSWIEDYALFMALKEVNQLRPWNEWPEEIAVRDPKALKNWHAKLQEESTYHKFLQFQFFQQWLSVKRYANERGVQVVGDIPIFVAYDSADTWANSDLFHLDGSGKPTHVAGVPPDYFSETGQRWGNPLYRWDIMKQKGYKWWIERFRQTFTMYDVVRVDHFRGFAAYWEVPVAEKTAVNGRWVEGPGVELFDAVKQELGEIPIIAEDLGVITPDVVELREATGFPGMRVLQFAFGGDSENPYLPHNHSRDSVVYTGTHDNDTTLGWHKTATKKEKEFLKKYTARARCEPNWELIRMALASVAVYAIAPLQDVLSLGTTARMNVPGTVGGNWNWRFRAESLTDELAETLAEMAKLYGRVQAK